MSEPSFVVVTPDMQVGDADQLHVVDASIMPNNISANINPPLMMIGDRAVDLNCRHAS